MGQFSVGANTEQRTDYAEDRRRHPDHPLDQLGVIAGVQTLVAGLWVLQDGRAVGSASMSPESSWESG